MSVVKPLDDTERTDNMFGEMVGSQKDLEYFEHIIYHKFLSHEHIITYNTTHRNKHKWREPGGR